MASTKTKEKQDIAPARWSPVPTPLEIAEGAAYKARCADPTNASLRAVHADAFNAMSAAPGRRYGTARCPECFVYYFGVLPGQGCKSCGHIRPPLNLPPLYPPPAPEPAPARPKHRSTARYDEFGNWISNRKPRPPRPPRAPIEERRAARAAKKAREIQPSLL